MNEEREIWLQIAAKPNYYRRLRPRSDRVIRIVSKISLPSFAKAEQPTDKIGNILPLIGLAETLQRRHPFRKRIAAILWRRMRGRNVSSN